MKRNSFAPWQAIALFAAVGVVMVFVQRDTDKALVAPGTPSTPPAVSAPVSVLPRTNMLRIPGTPYAVPADGKKHDIRITVVTDAGSYDAYAEQHKAGDRVQVEIPSVSDAQIRFYDNGKLRGAAKL